MKNFLRAGVLALCTLVFAGNARAAGYFVGEHDAVAMGRSLAVTAMLDEPSTIFFNPAGMAFMKGLRLQLGGVALVPSFNYSDPAGVRPAAEAIKQTIIAPHIYATYTFDEKGSIGIGFNSPFGLSLKWPVGFSGEASTAGIDMKMPTIYIGGAYRPIPQLSFGLTLRVIPGTVEMMQRFQVATDAGAMQYGWAHLAASGIGVGASFGIMARPVERLHLGFSYISRIKMGFNNGVVHFGFEDQTAMRDTSVFHDQTGSTSFMLPDILAAGVGYDIVMMPEHRLFAEFDFNWTMWSVFDKLQVNFDNDPSGTLSKPKAKNWKDVPCYRLGFEYRYKDFLAVRMGGGYDVTPAPNATVGPELPDSSRIFFDVGIGYRYEPLGLRADLSYGFTYFQPRTATTADGNPFPSTYKTIVHLVGLTVGLGKSFDDTAQQDEAEPPMPGPPNEGDQPPPPAPPPVL